MQRLGSSSTIKLGERLINFQANWPRLAWNATSEGCLTVTDYGAHIKRLATYQEARTTLSLFMRQSQSYPTH